MSRLPTPLRCKVIMSTAVNSSNLSCYEVYDTPDFVAVVAVRSSVSIVSFFCCLSMITFMVLLKKYRFFTQRLILYLAIAALSYSLASAVNVEAHAVYRTPSLVGYCVFTGFLEQLISWWVIMAASCIMVDLFVKVAFNKNTERFEIGYFLITFASPFLHSWIPFIDLAYGPSGAWCWIKDTSLEDCSSFLPGVWMRFFLYFVPLYIIMPVLLILLVVMLVLLWRQRTRWVGKFDHETNRLRKRMEKEIRPLLAYPVIFLIINLFPLVNRIVNISNPETPVVALYFIVGIIYPLQGTLVTIAFVLDPETRKKLRWKEISVAIKNCFIKETHLVSEYPLEDIPHSDSLSKPTK